MRNSTTTRLFPKLISNFSVILSLKLNFLFQRFGNAAKTINYVANGEASDWFLGKLGIFSISPELGDDAKISNEFYPPKQEILPILE